MSFLSNHNLTYIFLASLLTHDQAVEKGGFFTAEDTGTAVSSMLAEHCF
jgi:hypothetical protein